MTDSTRTIAALSRCFSDLTALTADLSEDAWATQSYCPEWNVRGVVDHLVGVEQVLLGWLPASADEWPPFNKIGDNAAQSASLSGAEYQKHVESVLEGRQAELAAMSPDQFDLPCQTPVGPATYGRFMNVRVYDFWLHQRDIAGPLGLATDDSGDAAEISLDEVHNSLGYIVGKKIGLPDGKSITFAMTGANDREMHVAVEGRAKVVGQLAEADVVVTADFLTFMLLSGGRIDPAAAIDAGSISWAGDNEWGEKAAKSLRFTI